MQLSDDSDEFQPSRPTISSSIHNTTSAPPNGPPKRKAKFVDDDMDEQTMMCFSRPAPDAGNDIVKTIGGKGKHGVMFAPFWMIVHGMNTRKIASLRTTGPSSTRRT